MLDIHNAALKCFEKLREPGFIGKGPNSADPEASTLHAPIDEASAGLKLNLRREQFMKGMIEHHHLKLSEDVQKAINDFNTDKSRDLGEACRAMVADVFHQALPHYPSEVLFPMLESLSQLMNINDKRFYTFGSPDEQKWKFSESYKDVRNETDSLLNFWGRVNQNAFYDPLDLIKESYKTLLTEGKMDIAKLLLPLAFIAIHGNADEKEGSSVVFTRIFGTHLKETALSVLQGLSQLPGFPAPAFEAVLKQHLPEYRGSSLQAFLHQEDSPEKAADFSPESVIKVGVERPPSLMLSGSKNKRSPSGQGQIRVTEEPKFRR